jgi:hypothetical protein
LSICQLETYVPALRTPTIQPSMTVSLHNNSGPT